MSLPLPSIQFGVFTSNKLKYQIEEKEDDIFRKKPKDYIQQIRNWLPEPKLINQASHIDTKNALHMVIENVEPIGMVRTVRTYFLTSNSQKLQKFNPVENFAGCVDNYELLVEKDSMFHDEYKLTSCYLKMVQTYLKFIGSLKSNLNKEVIKKVKIAIENKIKALNLKLHKSDKFEDKVNLEIKLYTLSGQEIDFYQTEGLSMTEFLVVLRFEIVDIRSVVDPTKIMGSIVVGDSFVFQNDYFLNLTKDAPYFEFFECRDEYSQPIREMKEIYAQKLLGERKVKKCGDIEIYLPFIDGLDTTIIDFPVTTAKASWFEKCLKFETEKIGCFILMNEDLLKAEFYRTISKPWVILHLKENIFFPKLCRPIICLRFSGQSYKDIFLDFMDHLKSQNVEVTDLETYPEYMLNSVCLRKAKLEKINEIDSKSSEKFISYKEQSETFKKICRASQLHNIVSQSD